VHQGGELVAHSLGSRSSEQLGIDLQMHVDRFAICGGSEHTIALAAQWPGRKSGQLRLVEPDRIGLLLQAEHRIEVGQ